MMIAFFWIVFFFLASFLLTLRWYERLGSTPALLLGAVAQPLFTALLFSFGMTFSEGLAHPDASVADSRALYSIFTFFAILTLVLATPLALLATIPVQRRVKSQRPKEFYDSLEGFEVLMAIGGVSSVCAAVAVGVLWVVVWWAVP